MGQAEIKDNFIKELYIQDHELEFLMEDGNKSYYSCEDSDSSSIVLRCLPREEEGFQCEGDLGELPVKRGVNTFCVRITREGTVVREYTISIVVKASPADVTLKALLVNDEEAVTAKDGEYYYYKVGADCTQAEVEAIPSDPKADVEGDLGLIDLEAGMNFLLIRVYSANRSNKASYQLAVEREGEDTGQGAEGGRGTADDKEIEEGKIAARVRKMETKEGAGEESEAGKQEDLRTKDRAGEGRETEGGEGGEASGQGRAAKGAGYSENHKAAYDGNVIDPGQDEAGKAFGHGENAEASSGCGDAGTKEYSVSSEAAGHKEDAGAEEFGVGGRAPGHRRAAGIEESSVSVGTQGHRRAAGTEESNESVETQGHRRAAGIEESNESVGTQEYRRAAGTEESNESVGTQEHRRVAGTEESNESVGTQEHRRAAGTEKSSVSVGTQEHRRAAGTEESGVSAGVTGHSGDAGAEEYSGSAGSPGHSMAAEAEESGISARMPGRSMDAGTEESGGSTRSPGHGMNAEAEESSVSDGAPEYGGDAEAMEYSKNEDAADPSSECRLSDLKVEGGILKPEFSPDVFDYKVNFQGEISEEILVEAVPMDLNAAVEGDMGLQGVVTGFNAFSVLCTAPDGVTKSLYKYSVEKRKPQESKVVKKSGQELKEKKKDYKKKVWKARLLKLKTAVSSKSEKKASLKQSQKIGAILLILLCANYPVYIYSTKPAMEKRTTLGVEAAKASDRRGEVEDRLFKKDETAKNIADGEERLVEIGNKYPHFPSQEEILYYLDSLQRRVPILYTATFIGEPTAVQSSDILNDIASKNIGTVMGDLNLLTPPESAESPPPSPREGEAAQEDAPDAPPLEERGEEAVQPGQFRKNVLAVTLQGDKKNVLKAYEDFIENQRLIVTDDMQFSKGGASHDGPSEEQAASEVWSLSFNAYYYQYASVKERSY